MSWRATILTLFPELFPGPLGASVLGRGLGQGLWRLDTVDIRDFADNPYRNVDDTPAGGGAGLVMRADILAAAIDSVDDQTRPRIALSARGRPFRQEVARRLADGAGAILVCGRFEGIDQRVLDSRGIDEISIGDFVLAGGEIAAMTLVEACVRLIPGVLGAAQSLSEESFSRDPDGRTLLEYPQYTRPRVFEGVEIPPVLTSGDHKKIAAWRRDRAIEVTRARRPDLLGTHSPVDEGPLRDRQKNSDG
ncbi:MAG: tRNA (guanosine(37)-N1)-methyltransferase TrmD [Alphaproteobacteria bacterium]|nr:tRNA (guanosine(37)-N1)-methyltransferase TrmD [Alphaproteobacteria bacterium]